MAKDTSTTGKDSSGNEFDRTSNNVVKKGLEKNAQRADETIVAQSKDASNSSIQAGNEKRMKGLPSAGSVPKNPNVPDPLTPKPTIEPLSLGKETARSKRNVGTGRKERTGVLNFGTLPSRPEGASKPASVNATARPEVASNVIDRMKSGMGLPGSENGDLDLALKLHARDLQTAKSTGKVVNDVSPNDPPATQHVHVYGGHHAAYARVMRVMGIADEEVYKNAASAAGMRLPAYIAGLHGKVVQHETSKKTMTHTLSGDEFWEHPKTKEIIPVKANHPDMPSSFTRSEGVINKVTRGADGSEVMDSGYSGWDKTKTRGGKGGQEVLRYSAGPTKGVDMIDHLRVQMLGEHGSSSSSRKKGASIANDIADVASGAVPRGMQRAGKRKVADAGFGKEKYVDNYIPANRPSNPRAFDKPQAPGVKGLTSRNAGRDTSAIQDGTYLLGTAELYDQNPKVPDFKSKGPKMVQDKLPGTGVPKYESTEVSPAEYTRLEGPLDKNTTEKIGQKASRKSKPWTEEDLAPVLRDERGNRVAAKKAVISTKTILTDRDDTSQSARDLNRGQQFAIDTTDMTGAGEVSALKSAGALVPSGKKAKKTKPMEQPTLFPDFSVKEGRKNAFYMAGSVVQASEATKQLQADSKRRFGRKEDDIAVEGKYSGANDAKLEQPEGSRADKKNVKKLASES
jgi:hypothetical protein